MADEKVINITSKNSDKKDSKKEKKSVNWGFLKLLLYVLIVMTIFVVGVVVGASAYPRVVNWLEEHNFMSQEERSEILKKNKNSNGEKSYDSDRNGINTEEVVVDVVERSSGGVVSIAISQVQVTNEGEIDTSANIGSGFIISENGLIITNQHVVSDPNVDYVVVDSEGNEYQVAEISRDNVNDLALLKLADCVDGEQGEVCKKISMQALPLGNSDQLKVGELVIAIGTPLGEYAGSVTSGIVSGLNRSVTASPGGFWGVPKVYDDVIQTDAAVNPGNSGGPLLNADGEVIGVNFATTSGADNISFALPVDIAKSRLEEYRKYGKFLMPFLGVQVGQYFNEFEARYYTYNGKPIEAGAMIKYVVPGSAAEQAGLQRNDIVMEIEGEKVRRSLANMIEKYEVGEEISLRVWRDGEVFEVKVKLGERG